MLIKPYEPERKGAQIVIPEGIQGRMSMADNRALVVEVGPNAWHDEPSARARAGDKVLVTKFAGFTAKGPKDGETYRLVNDRDIFCAITDEAEVANV